jgi:hypothetical protein
MTKSKTTQRNGIQALYSFTPFALLFSRNKDDYGMILVPSPFYSTEVINGKSSRYKRQFTDNDWYHGSYNKFEYYDDSGNTGKLKTVVHPYLIKPKIFSRNTPFEIEYTHNDLSKTRKSMAKWDYTEPFPKLMKFSYESLTQGYNCRYGFILITDEKNCPLANKCKLFQPGNSTKTCKHYVGPNTYERLYKVMPHIVRTVREDPFSDKEILALIQVNIKGHDRILGKIKYDDKLSLEAFLDATIFKDNMADLYYLDYLWVSYKEAIGFKQDNLHGIVIQFNPQAMDEYVEELLNNSPSIRDWMCLKMNMYFGYDAKYIRLRKSQSSTRGFKALSRFSNLLNDIKATNSNSGIGKYFDCDSDSPKFENLKMFTSFVLIHTIAHVFVEGILSLFSPSPHNQFLYYIEHPIFGDSKENIYIIDTIQGGSGVLKILSELIKSQPNQFTPSMNMIVNYIIQSYSKHEKTFNKNLANLSVELQKYKNQLNELVDRVIDIYDSWRSCSKDTFPLHVAVRNYLAENFQKEIYGSSENRSYFKDLISELPLCWDGCSACVGMDKGCMFMPFDQPFLISRNLVTMFLNTAVKWLGKSVFTIASGITSANSLLDVFKDLILLAERDIILVSPWISKDTINILNDIKYRRSIKVKVITLDSEQNRRAIEEAENNSNDPIIVLKFPEDKKEKLLHLKALVIDGSIAVTGSANYTNSGLGSNIEIVNIILDPDNVKSVLKQIEDIEKSIDKK